MRRNLLPRAVKGKWRLLQQSPLVDHVSDLDLEMRAVVTLGERAARKVTADGTVILASLACTYTCTPSLIFLSFRCSNTPFKSSPFVGNLGSFCPNIYASLQNSVLSAYVVFFFFLSQMFLSRMC